jgi:hypothetical protein
VWCGIIGNETMTAHEWASIGRAVFNPPVPRVANPSEARGHRAFSAGWVGIALALSDRPREFAARPRRLCKTLANGV